MSREHTYCLKWSEVAVSFISPLPIFPLIPAFALHLLGFEKFWPFCLRNGYRSAWSMSRLAWPSSCLWKNRSWKDRSWGPFTSGPFTWPFRESRALQREEAVFLRLQLNEWAHALTQHPGSSLPATECASILFKILPPIGRKITHSWVMKSHLCSAASWCHIILLYLI